jgi:aryl-alcohol dehydrogenase-like predicted oxidoreductase
MKKLKSKGCEIHARSAFLQGLIFMNPDGLSDRFEEVKFDIQQLQNRFGSSLSGVMLKYVLNKEFIDRVVIGVQNAEQLLVNLVEVKASPEIKPLNKRFSEQVIVPSNWKK